MSKLIVCDVCDTLFNSNTTFDFIRFYTRKKPVSTRVVFWLFISRLSPVFYGLVILGRLARKDLIRTLAIRLLKGASVETLRTSSENFYSQVLQGRKNEAVFKLLEKERTGNTLMLVSSSLHPVVQVIANHLICDYRASELQLSGGICTGLLDVDLTGTKHLVVKAWIDAGTAMTVITDNQSDVELVRMSRDRYVVIKHERDKAFWNELSPTYIKV